MINLSYIRNKDNVVPSLFEQKHINETITKANKKSKRLKLENLSSQDTVMETCQNVLFIFSDGFENAIKLIHYYPVVEKVFVNQIIDEQMKGAKYIQTWRIPAKTMENTNIEYNFNTCKFSEIIYKLEVFINVGSIGDKIVFGAQGQHMRKSMFINDCCVSIKYSNSTFESKDGTIDYYLKMHN